MAYFSVSTRIGCKMHMRSMGLHGRVRSIAASEMRPGEVALATAHLLIARSLLVYTARRAQKRVLPSPVSEGKNQ